MTKPHILLTNDDGIRSPGLWAAAEALSRLGFVTVAAPREQFSGAGRSLPATSEGSIRAETVTVHGQTWQVYAVGGTPAQAVQHGVLEILGQRPDLLVSGINYGENTGTGITVSGTVGAAMEAASMGIPALAMSLETDKSHHLSYSTEIDFSTAAYFTDLFAGLMLGHALPSGVDLIKVDVPAAATPSTPWEWTRLSTQRYYVPVKPARKTLDQPGKMDYEVKMDYENEPQDSDVYTLIRKQLVSVTPLTLDLTARVESRLLNEFASPGDIDR